MKFSIRDLLLVTVIVALAVGWWADRSKLEAEVRDLSLRLQIQKPYTVAPIPIPSAPPQIPPRNELADSDSLGENGGRGSPP
jgi:hypothetical protein